MRNWLGLFAAVAWDFYMYTVRAARAACGCNVEFGNHLSICYRFEKHHENFYLNSVPLLKNTPYHY
jgi:hypothetical protein